MRARYREDVRYELGAQNPVSVEEKILFGFLGKLPRGRILDIGCGIGTHAAVMMERGFDVVGLDFSVAAIDRANRLGITVLAADADTYLPFRNCTFDYVWATDVLEHVFDPIGLIEEIFRVLTPRGRVLVTVPNDLNLKSRIRIFLSGRSPQSKVYRTSRQYKHHTLFSMELLKYMLVDAGCFKLEFMRAACTGTNHLIRSEFLASLFGSTFVAVCSK